MSQECMNLLLLLLISIFNQENWENQLYKIFVDLNLFFQIIDNE